MQHAAGGHHADYLAVLDSVSVNPYGLIALFAAVVFVLVFASLSR